MRKNSKRAFMIVAIMGLTLFNTSNVHSQFLKKIASKAKSLTKKNTNSTQSKSSSKAGAVNYVTKNKLNSRFGSGFSNLKMLKDQQEKKGVKYDVLHFGAGNKLAFKLYPRFVYDDYHRDVDGVYTSLFTKDGEEVYHIAELQGVIDKNGEKHSFSHIPSPSMRVLKTPDDVFLVYTFDGGKKIGQKYPYFVSSKSNVKGPFVIAAPSSAKFDEWSGEKALNYVKDFEKRVKIGCFKFMPKKGKLHTPELAESCKQAIYKKLRKYRNNANLEIRRLVVYSDNWKEKTDDVTDEVTDRQLIAYYLYVNGEKTDIHAAKINQKNTGSGFAKEMVVEKNYSDKFSKDIPVSLVNKYFK